MLADLLTDIFTDTAIGSATSIRNKTILLVFGLLMVAAGAGLLFYFRTLPPIVAADYHSTEIKYSQVYYDDRKDYLNIVLVSDKQNYNIYHQIWRKHYSSQTIVDELGQHNQAKIWLATPGSREIKGIETPTFVIDLSFGMAWDEENRGAGKSLGWLFIGLGGFLMVALLFSALVEKKKKPKRWL